MRVLITGGAGFVGHHFVEAIFRETDWEIIVLDRLSYAGSLNRLKDIEAYHNPRVHVFTADFANDLSHLVKELGKIDLILHLGAETHVDRSIACPEDFVRSNVQGTMHILNLARQLGCGVYYFSTDEVFGPAGPFDEFSEFDPLKPNNPYASTKAAGEMLCWAWRNTYKVPILITRTMNIFGERQHPEKFIPLCIRKILNGEWIGVHATSDLKHSGTRGYIHARNVADGYLHLIHKGVDTGIVHIAAQEEVSNEEVVLFIGQVLDIKPNYDLVDANLSRPGHDIRYALSNGVMESQYHWTPPKPFWESLEKTILWYLGHRHWLEDRNTVQPAAASA